MAHSLAPVIPILVASLTAPIVIWSNLYVQWTQRARGRRAVEAELARRGETALSIETVPVHRLPDRAGLCAIHAFRIEARTADGATTTHLWAYEPGLFTNRRAAGLKRLAHGIWIPA